MKTYRTYILCLLLSFGVLTPILTTSCSTPPSERVQAVQTLKAVGLAADSAMKVAGALYVEGKLTEDKKAEILVAHAKFQAAYNLAVAGVQADLTIASPDLVALFSQLQTLINANK